MQSEKVLPAVVFGGAGLLFLTFGLFAGRKDFGLLANGRTASGRVVDVVTEADPRSASPSQYLSFPLVQFRDQRGATHTLRSQTSRRLKEGSLSTAGWRVGERVTVRYRPEAPQEAKIGLDLLMPAVMAAFGLGALVLGIKIWSSS